jgi:hypothetical protein
MQQHRRVAIDLVAPGGYHLTCTSPDKDLAPGRSTPVTLSFLDGSTITVNFAVRGPSGHFIEIVSAVLLDFIPLPAARLLARPPS